jgi:hypothetical protein
MSLLSPFSNNQLMASPYGKNIFANYHKNQKVSSVTMLDAYKSSLQQWHTLGKKEKAKPLEKVMGRLCEYIEKEYGYPYFDLTENNNFKNNPHTHHTVDYAMVCLAALEGKNLDCPNGNNGNGYFLSQSFVNENIIDRFTAYDEETYPYHFAIVAKPIYGESVKIHILKNNVIVAELGYVVTDNELVMNCAFNTLKLMFDKILRQLGIERLPTSTPIEAPPTSSPINTNEIKSSESKKLTMKHLGYFNTILTRITRTSYRVNLTSSFNKITSFVSSKGLFRVRIWLKDRLFKVKLLFRARFPASNKEVIDYAK